MLLGSASLTLQQGLADSLAGRYELIRADHWDLGECEKAFGWDLDTFLKFGGYPGCAELIADVPRWRAFIRDSVVEPVLLKDLLAMTAITKPALFRQTFELAMAYCDRPGDCGGGCWRRQWAPPYADGSDPSTTGAMAGRKWTTWWIPAHACMRWRSSPGGSGAPVGWRPLCRVGNRMVWEIVSRSSVRTKEEVASPAR